MLHSPIGSGGFAIRRVSARLQDIVETYQIALYISIRIRDRISHTSLCSQIHNHLWLMLLKEFIHHRLISDTAVYHGKAIELLQSAKSLLLDMHIIVVVHIINTHYLDVLHFLQQSKSQVAANKASSTCYEDCLPR